jgi:hypothetical protein
MKTINETFTDEEFEILLKRKGKKSWHDFILGKKLKPKVKDVIDDNGRENPEEFDSEDGNRLG